MTTRNRRKVTPKKTRAGRTAKIQALPIYTETQEEADAINEFLSTPGLEITMEGKGNFTAKAFPSKNGKQGRRRFDVEIDAGLFLEISDYRDLFSKTQIQVAAEALELWLLRQKFLALKKSNKITFYYHSSNETELMEILKKYSENKNFKYEDKNNQLLSTHVHTQSKITIEGHNQVISNLDLVKLSRIAELKGGLEIIPPKK